MINISSFWLWWQQHNSKMLASGQQKAEIKNKWQSIWQLIMLNGKRSVIWLGIKGAFQRGREKIGRQTASKKLWNNFRKMFLNVKFPKFWRAHHLQCIISCKDSEKQKEHLCTRDKVDGQKWTFGPLSSTALKHALYWTALHGLRNTSRNHWLWTQFVAQSRNASWSCIMQRGSHTWSRNSTALKCFWGQTVVKCFQIKQNLKFSLGTMNSVFCRLKRRGTISKFSDGMELF